MTTNATTFQPDWISPPGATISRILTRRGMSFNDFATEIDAPVHVVQDLVQGIGTVDESLAKQLANVLGASPTFWMDREREYRADAERLRTSLHAATGRDWLRELPVRDSEQAIIYPLQHGESNVLRAGLDRNPVSP